MRRVLLFACGLLSAVGCTRFAGPLAVRNMDRADAPGYTIAEQEQRGRQRLAIAEDDFRIGPSTNGSRPSPTGR